jgi:hypothetical protein
VALRDLVFQDQTAAQWRACGQAAVVGHDGDIVLFVHQDGGWIQDISYHLSNGIQKLN